MRCHVFNMETHTNCMIPKDHLRGNETNRSVRRVSREATPAKAADVTPPMTPRADYDDSTESNVVSAVSQVVPASPARQDKKTTLKRVLGEQATLMNSPSKRAKQPERRPIGERLRETLRQGPSLSRDEHKLLVKRKEIKRLTAAIAQIEEERANVDATKDANAATAAAATDTKAAADADAATGAQTTERDREVGERRQALIMKSMERHPSPSLKEKDATAATAAQTTKRDPFVEEKYRALTMQSLPSHPPEFLKEENSRIMCTRCGASQSVKSRKRFKELPCHLGASTTQGRRLLSMSSNGDWPVRSLLRGELNEPLMYKVPVPSDGLCFYYSAVVCGEDLAAWLSVPRKRCWFCNDE